MWAMRAWIDQQILYLHAEDVPCYKKQGSIVRNNYFWALHSIADRAPMGKHWEFADVVWVAVSRLLASFETAGYLYRSELILEFSPEMEIPVELRSVSTYL